MQRMFLVMLLCICGVIAASAQNPTSCRIIFPNGGETFRPGSTQNMQWDTTGTFRARWRFAFATSPAGPWTTLTGLTNVLDSGTTRGSSVPTSGGWRVPATGTTSGYLKMELISDPNVFDISDNPFTIESPATIAVDSTLKGEINGTVYLKNTKVYGLEGYVYVNNGAKLYVEPGTIIVGGVPGENSALIINRGGQIFAEGTKDRPVVFTSRAAPGQRRAGDWGGILIAGRARINQPAGQAPLEGGVADATAGGKGWYGGTDDNDNSGVLKYVRIEFAGIATQPNSELNSLTMGGVGRGTTIDYVQCSFGNDDSFEWFGGTVNARHIIAYGGLDDDFDCDNGFSGKVQFVLSKRIRTVADVSTSQTFEIDNDAQGSFNKPYTSVLFSNVTSIGPIQDTNWTTGSGANQYNSRYGAAAQIRRNARASIFNSVIIGWPRGIEIAQVPTMAAALADSLAVRNNSWFGVKSTWLNLAGGTAPAGLTTAWISNTAFNNTLDASNPNNAFISNPFANDNSFNPTPSIAAPYANTAKFDNGDAALFPIDDPFFEKVSYRGAFAPGSTRWDEGWTEYDPINAEYRAEVFVHITSPGSKAGEKYTPGQKVTITFDTTNAAGNIYKFEFGTSPNGPWTAIAGLENVTDGGATRGKIVDGFTVPNTPTTTGYIKQTLVADAGIFDVSDFAFTIEQPVVLEPVVRLIEPGTNSKTFRVGQSVSVTWDTTRTAGQRWKFEFGKSATGPWTALAGLDNVLDSAARRGTVANSIVFRNADVTTTGYIKMSMVSDPTKFDINDEPFTITAPVPSTCDSTLSGAITGNVTLHRNKIYCLEGYVYVNDGATLEIEPGTVIFGGVPGENSALVINRGGKIKAEGTAQKPIVFTSRAVLGQRRAGDWGGILIAGKARINQPAGQAPLEGGVSDATAGGKGWYGGTDDEDNSGVLKYVRIEFAGIATQPNSELNGLTMGGVGRGTTLDYIQVSHGNDDAFEWFGGTVNARHLIAISTLDDDFDCDNGFRGRVQWAISQRARTVADVSTSQTFETDNDAQGSYNLPYTAPVFSNVTSIGPIQDTSWITGSGANQYSSRFGAAVQIRRNSRTNIHNSVFLGWPRGIEIAQVPTMAAALADSFEVRNNAWYGVKGSVLNLAGGTAPVGMDAQWIAKTEFGNVVDKSSPNGAMIEGAFTTGAAFNPALMGGSPLATGAKFEGTASDSFFEQVSYRGAFGTNRWDATWANYDPNNTEYRADTTSVEEDVVAGEPIAASISPNPTMQSAQVRYTLNSSDVVSVEVFNATGSVRSRFFSNEQQAQGEYEFTLITSDLASGVYYVAIIGQRGTITIPVTVIR